MPNSISIVRCIMLIYYPYSNYRRAPAHPQFPLQLELSIIPHTNPQPPCRRLDWGVRGGAGSPPRPEVVSQYLLSIKYIKKNLIIIKYTKINKISMINIMHLTMEIEFGTSDFIDEIITQSHLSFEICFFKLVLL